MSRTHRVLLGLVVAVAVWNGSRGIWSEDAVSTHGDMARYLMNGVFLRDLVVSGEKTEGGTMIVPGHGRVSDEADLVEYRDMVHVISDRFATFVGKDRLTRPELKERRPLIGWERRYSRPEWTTEMFVDAVYDEFVGGGQAR